MFSWYFAKFIWIIWRRICTLIISNIRIWKSFAERAVFDVPSIKKTKKMEHLYQFQYKLSQTNEICTNQHGLLPTSIWCFKIFPTVRLHGGSLPNFIFFNLNSQIWQRNCKVHYSNCLDTNFHISDIILTVIRRRNYR